MSNSHALFYLKVLSVLAVVFLSACTARDVREFTYSAAASHQCNEDFQNNPNGQIHSSDCINNKELDGKDFDEYEEDRRRGK